MSSSADIRRLFLDHFARAGHTIVESSPLVPRNDPTLMFANSGMVQFKNVFTGVEQRPYRRATTAQKCVRAGGKHNDLENVGYTARHHTFFEMLGNFSFGDYFKDVAIDLAWDLVTKGYGLPADRLLVTVYADDDEAFGLWKRIAGLPDDRIIRIATSDNFWRMGDTGPCGPCSEIFYDHGPHVAGGPPGSPDADGDRFIEIWNLVFMQYDQRGPGDMVPLPRPSIDTGMGLERLAAILQGKHDNYDTDVMRGLILASAEASGSQPDGPHAVSHRVIADHLRATSFLIADGVLPSNEGRGYVLRRIMRRAMRHAHHLRVQEPLLYRLVPTLVREMGDDYPELRRAESLIRETLQLEEVRFRQLLDRGLRLLDEEVQKLPADAPLPGRVAFTLYDTFGFPFDLTADVMRGQGRAIDQAEFESAMAAQRQKARAAWAGTGESATDGLWFELKDQIGATEFLGYSTEMAEAVVQAIVRGADRVDQAETGETVQLILNQSPFYAESGGQVGDTGVMVSAAGTEATVLDTQKRAGAVWVHTVRVDRGRLAVGMPVECRVDALRRAEIRANHSATHLLHEALRRRLGTHVTQKGSLVAPDRLRFDISQPVPVASDALRAVEQDVNARIRENAVVTTRLMSPEAAIAEGAMALFGEKYGDEVRVVSMGQGAPGESRAYSVELCGGTHVDRTGDIGLFKIVSEGAVAAGVRRVEALTGRAALDHFTAQERLLMETAAALKVPAVELPGRLSQLVEDRRRLERDVADLRRQLALGGSSSAATDRRIGSAAFVSRIVPMPAKELRPLVEAMLRPLESGVAAVVGTDEGKASLVVAVTADLLDRVSAVELVRTGAERLGGRGGGGRPELAQAGGSDAGGAEAAIDAVQSALARALGVEA